MRAVQISVLEALVSNVEKVAYHLASKKSKTALNSSRGPVPLQISAGNGSNTSSGFKDAASSNPSNPRSNSAAAKRRPASGRGATGKLLKLPPSSAAAGNHIGAAVTGDLLELESPMHSSHSNGNVATYSTATDEIQQTEDSGQGGAMGKGNLHSIAEALVQLESLRCEIDRFSMGLTLLGLSVEKLMDIAAAPPSCCGSIFDILLPAAEECSGSYSAPSPGRIGTASHSSAGSNNSSSSSGSSRGSAGRLTGAPSLNKVLGMRAAGSKKGYANINAQSDGVGSGVANFSIESNDED